LTTVLFDLEPLPLRAEHRCDRCGARAQARAFIGYPTSGLLFCAHHAAKHEAALSERGWTLHRPPLED
jgi:hypothetical protein